MLRFAMAKDTLRERYTQHNKTGSFILWLTLTFKNADGETRTRKGYAHTHLKRARIPIPPHPRGFEHRLEYNIKKSLKYNIFPIFPKYFLNGYETNRNIVTAQVILRGLAKMPDNPIVC